MSGIVDVNTLFGPLPVANIDLTVESLLALMQRHQVQAACTISTLGMLLDPAVGNAMTRATCTENPVLRPAATLNPTAYFGDTDSLTRLRDDGFCCIRLFPDAQGWPLEYAPFHALADDLRSIGLPLMIDITAPGQMSQLAHTLHDYPGPVILAGVNAETLAESITLLRSHPQWHLETSNLLAPGCIKAVVHALGAERLLFGSHAPSRPIASVLSTLHYIGLPDSAQSQIFSENAHRLLPNLA